MSGHTHLVQADRRLRALWLPLWRRSPSRAGASQSVRARLLAWGCLVSVVLAAVLIVTSTLDSHARTASAGNTDAAGQTRSRCCWIVKPGQTLDSIAAKESVLPSAMTRVNPGVVPGRLIPGQRLRLPA